MILALRTGWTPDVMTELPSPFRENAHWALYAEGYAERFGKIAMVAETDPPRGMASAPHRDFINTQKAAKSALRWLKETLFPADEPTDG